MALNVVVVLLHRTPMTLFRLPVLPLHASPSSLRPVMRDGGNSACTSTSATNLLRRFYDLWKANIMGIEALLNGDLERSAAELGEIQHIRPAPNDHAPHRYSSRLRLSAISPQDAQSRSQQAQLRTRTVELCYQFASGLFPAQRALVTKAVIKGDGRSLRPVCYMAVVV
jgi:hypothetical protein